MRRPNHLNRKEVAREAQDWRQKTMEYHLATPGQMIAPPTWRRDGLEKIVNEAIGHFQRKTGIYFPYNVDICAPYYGRSRNRKHGDMEVAEKVFRFCGWLRAAANFPFIQRTFRWAFATGRGMNSPYTLIDPWKVAGRFTSPGACDRLIRKARTRANKILRAYGLYASWDAICRVVETGPKRVGKAAEAMAAETIQQYCTSGQDWKYLGGLYGTPREILMKARGLRDALRISHVATRWAIEVVEDGQFACIRDALTSGRLSIDKTDGVVLWVDSATMTTLHGITAVKGWNENCNKYWLVRAVEHSYHCEAWHEAKKAVRYALQAWRRQRQLKRQEQNLISNLQPTDRDILIWRADSYAAGNCELGTDAFANRQGWDGREFVPAAWLINHIQNPGVKRTLRVVAAELAAVQ